MPIVTVQLGQCGNQLGVSWFDSLAAELFSSGNLGTCAADAYFEQHAANAATRSNSTKQWTARAVMVDMEPKVIYSAKQQAVASNHSWCYGKNCAVSGQSGSGNNWALGHNKYGPAVAPAVLELVRKQVEACDVCEGFLLLQSMAGGTGAGAGTYMAEALIDEYSNAHMLNCCIWPFAAGEVTVQPYNTLLSMSALAEVSSGILLMQNEVLHATCTRLLGIKQPSFQDLNAVAARGLAGALLPCKVRPPIPARPSSSPAGGAVTSSRPLSTGSKGRRRQQEVQQHAHAIGKQYTADDMCQVEDAGHMLHMMADLTCHLFSHPSYRLASIRYAPQLPSASIEFTTFTWPATLRRLKAMCLSGSFLDDGPLGTSASTAAVPRHKYKNKAATSMLVLRGNDAGTVPVGEFVDANWYAAWAVDPLLVAAHRGELGRCQHAATLLATDQACVVPLEAMLAKAYAMLSARAYIHQYEAHGLTKSEFDQCFAVVEDALAAYAML